MAKKEAVTGPTDKPVVGKLKGKHLEIIGVAKPLTPGKHYKVREKVALDYIKQKVAKLANPE